MRRVQDYESGLTIRELGGHPTSKNAAPVVTNQVKARAIFCRYHRLPTRRGGRPKCWQAYQFCHSHADSELLCPALPKVREAVKEDYRWATRLPGGSDLHPEVATTRRVSIYGMRGVMPIWTAWRRRALSLAVGSTGWMIHGIGRLMRGLIRLLTLLAMQSKF